MSINTNNFLRRFVFLETFSTPIEFLAAAQLAREVGDMKFFDMIETSHSMTVLREDSTPSSLVCESETRYARLYSSGGSSRQRLIVAFTGAAMRLMMPLPIFMQALPQNTDLLILYDPKKNHYRSGIWDGNATISDFASLFPRLFGLYSDTVALGTSIGGLPAIRFAKHAGLRRSISFGGQKIDDTLRILRREALEPAFDPLCACDRKVTTEAIFVYPANNMQDALSARCASVATNSHLIALARRKHHGVLWDIVQMKRLPDLLEMLFSSTTLELHAALCSWSEVDLCSTALGQSS
jgi:hypothetical protein